MISELYLNKSANERCGIIKEELKSYGDIFKISIDKDEVIITYIPYDLEFVYVLSGILKRGFSESEYQQALKICRINLLMKQK